jgi:hypothetical protein
VNRSRESLKLFAVGVLWFLFLLQLVALFSACGRTVTAPECFADPKADTLNVRDSVFNISWCSR